MTTHPPQRGISTLAILGVFLLVAGGFIGWSMYKQYVKNAELQQTALAAQKSQVELTRLASQFMDGMQLAASTPRIGLAGPVGKLQNVRQEVQAVVVPECQKESKEQLSIGMNEGILSFMEFMRNDMGKDMLESSLTLRTAAMTTSFGKFKELLANCPLPK